jgi:hypothetical protein
MLTADDSQVTDFTSKFIWHIHVPIKVALLARRLLCNRFPTKSNLLARGIISSEAHLCVSGCGEVETAQHLFVSCNIFSELWQLVRGWIRVSGVDLSDIHEHFHQFMHPTGESATRRSFLQMLWLLRVWVLWSERNNMFQNKVTDMHQLVEKIKFHSY